MEHPFHAELPSHPDVTPLVRARADLVRTELDVGFTFIDIAKGARNPTHARRYRRIAISALRTTDRFLKQTEVGDADIRERRKQLRNRLREAVLGARIG